MTTTLDQRMNAAILEWTGLPEDPLELALPCPYCDSAPKWERVSSLRFRLNCCHTNDYDRGHYSGKEQDFKAVYAWNEAAQSEAEDIRWTKWEEKQKREKEEEDAWVDANLPMLP